MIKVKTEEQELIDACRKGKSWAQKKIYDLYAPAMMSVCVRYVNDRETARDLLQDGFVKVFTRMDSFTGAGAFGGWVRRIFVTTALEFLRQQDALRQSDNFDDVGYAIVDSNENVIDKLTAAELMQCIAALPDGYRTIFNLYAIEGFSHAEIADLLQISEVTSRTQLMRARKLLQKTVNNLFLV